MTKRGSKPLHLEFSNIQSVDKYNILPYLVSKYSSHNSLFHFEIDPVTPPAQFNCYISNVSCILYRLISLWINCSDSKMALL